MRGQFRLRPHPVIQASALSRVLTGEEMCLWSAWYRARHYYHSRPSDFDTASWTTEHTSLLRSEAGRLIDDGWTVTVEGQNEFQAYGKIAYLTGKPDIIAVKGDTGRIIDAKTGQPKNSHSIQVLIYMWMVPLALKQFRGIKFSGEVAYKVNRCPISPESLTPEMIDHFSDNIRAISDSSPPGKTPSKIECGRCKITDDDCGERLQLLTADDLEEEDDSGLLGPLSSDDRLASSHE